MNSEHLLSQIVGEKVSSEGFFKLVFGRKPDIRCDRTFLLNYLGTIDKTKEDILQGFLNSGVTKPQLKALFEVGIIPTTSNSGKIPKRLLERWLKIVSSEDATSEINERLDPSIMNDEVGEVQARLYLELSSSVIRICHLMETGAKAARRSDIGILFLYLLARTVQFLRSIRVLVNNDETSSVQALARGMYECFGRMVLANRRPDLAFGLLLPALVDGSKFEYCKNKKGKIEKKKVRNIETGAEFRVEYSLNEIFSICDADRDLKAHAEIYWELSNEIHPSAELLFDFVKEDGFLLHRKEDMQFLIYMIGYVLFLIWREVSVFPLLSKRDRRDANYALSVVRDALLTVIEKILPFAKVSRGDSFSQLFMDIHEAVSNPYDDKYWREFVS